MSYEDPKRSQQPREQASQPAQAASQSVIAPGKRRQTESLPAPTGAPAAVLPPVQQKPDPARSKRVQLTRRWLNTVVRPDLFPPPVDAASAGDLDGALQMRGSADQAALSSSAVHELAGAGTSGASTSLPHLDRIQQSFGPHDVSGVQAHVGGPATEASQAMGAEAYATGNHVAFRMAPDLHTAAHEAAHVVQQRAGVQLSGGVGQVGDTYEQQADAVADRVVAGQSAADLLAPDPSEAGKTLSAHEPEHTLQQRAANVQRDALVDIDEALDGNWVGIVDGAEVVRRFEALSPAKRKQIVQNDRATMRRVVRSLNAFQMTQVFALIPRNILDLRWKVYWLIIGGQIESMSLQQWRWIAVYNSPDDWTALRAYPDGYRAVLQHCPTELITPWDLLEGVKNGMWTGDAVHIRNAASNLNTTQRENVRADNAKMRAIVTRCGDAHEAFRTVRYLNTSIADTCAWLNQAGHLPSLDNNEWGQLFGEATRAEVDDLVTNRAALWTTVQTHCPAGIIAAARGGTQQVPTAADPTITEANINNQLNDPVQLQALLTTMGPAGFLGMCCTDGANVAANYNLVKAANKVPDVVNGLQPGYRMGDRTMANLRQWFMLETGTLALAQLMFEKRFNVTAGGTGSYTHSATLAAWNIPALQQMWPVLERLPPVNVEGNRRLVNVLASTAGSGSAYYGHLINDPSFLSGDVVMGGQNALAGNRTDAAFGPSVYSAGGRGAGTAPINMNVFNSTLRHEIGHAVDRQLGIMDTWGSQDSAGNWIKYGSAAEFVDAIIAAGGGLGTSSAPLHGYPAADVGVYRQAMINAVTNNQGFQTALVALKPSATVPPPDAGPISAVFQSNRFTGNGNGPWYNPGNWKPLNGRNFQKAYPSNMGSLYSFKNAIRTARGVTQYQWRAPGEWFAEVYQVYYAEQETAPDAPVGGLLRSRDPRAAEMMTTIVDRGHSPQEMQGGATRNAPGT